MADGVALSLDGHTHSFASITGKPTTLAGYGITDAVSTGVLAAKNATAITSSLTSLTNATGVALSLAANSVYAVKFLARFSSATANAGVRLGITSPAGSEISFLCQMPVRSDATGAFYQGTITASGDSVLGTGVETANVGYTAVIEGTVVTTTAGAIQLQFASEIAGSTITIMLGSIATAQLIP